MNGISFQLIHQDRTKPQRMTLNLGYPQSSGCKHNELSLDNLYTICPKIRGLSTSQSDIWCVHCKESQWGHLSQF